MKEYRIQLVSASGHLVNLHQFVKHPLKTLSDAKEKLAKLQFEHPENRYRIIERTVTEWEEVI